MKILQLQIICWASIHVTCDVLSCHQHTANITSLPLKASKAVNCLQPMLLFVSFIQPILQASLSRPARLLIAYNRCYFLCHSSTEGASTYNTYLWQFAQYFYYTSPLKPPAWSLSYNKKAWGDTFAGWEFGHGLKNSIVITYSYVPTKIIRSVSAPSSEFLRQ